MTEINRRWLSNCTEFLIGKAILELGSRQMDVDEGGLKSWCGQFHGYALEQTQFSDEAAMQDGGSGDIFIARMM